MKITVDHNGLRVKQKQQYLIWCILYFVMLFVITKIQRRYLPDLSQVFGGWLDFILPIVSAIIVIFLEYLIYRKDLYSNDKYFRIWFKFSK